MQLLPLLTPDIQAKLERLKKIKANSKDDELWEADDDDVGVILRHLMPDVRVLIHTLVELGKVEVMLPGGDIVRSERISIPGADNPMSLDTDLTLIVADEAEDHIA